MEHVKMSIDGAVALVELDRPPVNALSAAVAEELKEAFTACQDPAIRSVVVTGRPHFAAGADIKAFKETLDSGSKERSAWTLVEAISILEGLAKPTIAAVHGFALGGGCELSMGCDFRYVADDSRIGQPEILLGIIPGAGGTQRLSRLVGFQKAKELVFSGRHVFAEEALAIGYADKVAPSDELLDVALEDAAKWATMPTIAIAAAKRAMAIGWGSPLATGMEAEREAFQEAFASADAVEGVNAFVEKRQPNFSGK